MTAGPRVASLFACLCIGALPACDGCRDANDEAPTADPSATPASAEEAPPPEPPPVLTIGTERADPDESGVWTAVLQNRGAGPTRLATELTVQREVEGAWRDVATLTLRASCGAPTPEGCVALVPGGELRPPAWLGREGAAQCACPECPAAAHGRYRFIARSCDGAHAVPGEAFMHVAP